MRPELARHFSALFPSTVVGVELSDPELAAPLYPEEAVTVARAVDKRKNEFALGRTAARKALRALGLPAMPLKALPDRSVEWPERAWGSITHADGICAAVATLREHHRGVGIDAEVRQRVKRELWRHIATERELAWLQASADEDAAAHRATLLFSAKEAFYKAQFCASHGWVGFQDANVTCDDSSAFEVELLVDVGETFAKGTRFEGKYVVLEKHVVTGVTF